MDTSCAIYLSEYDNVKFYNYISALEDNIIVVFISEKIFRSFNITLFLSCLCFLVQYSLSLSSFGVSFFLSRYLLQSIEFFSIEFVELRVNILDSILSSRYDDVFTSYDKLR
jgi:hypothetical protein